jgi:DNA-binding MarR family transcriptional regulator
MNENIPPELDPNQFVLEYIDSVPQLEALMLLWNSRPVAWTAQELASRLYLAAEKVDELLRDLIHRNLIVRAEGKPAKYSYNAQAEKQNKLMEQVDLVYRRDLVRISTMIHSKTSPSLREFARAFRFKKD